MYSQSNEEAVLLPALPLHGRLLDIGAYDGSTFSNSRALIERGWSAVMVEPAVGPFLATMKLYADNKNVTLVHALVSPSVKTGGQPLDALIKFWNSDDAVGTSDSNHHERWKSNARFQEIWCPQVTVDDLLKKFPGPYDFINVDTEGTTAQIFASLPLEQLGFPVICVEHNGRDREPILAKMAEANAAGANYGIVLDNRENFIMVRK